MPVRVPGTMHLKDKLVFPHLTSLWVKEREKAVFCQIKYEQQFPSYIPGLLWSLGMR